MSTLSTSTSLGRELRQICGAPNVTEDPLELSRMAILDVVPGIAITPASGEEVSAVLRFANEHGLTVAPAGGLSQQQSGPAPEGIDILLRTTRLTHVEHYDPGDLTVGIGAGCTVAQLSSMVAADGLLFAGDPALPERCTVGGLLATGRTGPQRQGYGGLRDYCIGIRFVTGDGRKAKGGGRVVKNVAGYDLMKLLIGSHGTLAVITSASFKLFPAPRQTRTFVADFATAAEAIEFRNRILQSPLSPLCLELVSPDAHASIAPRENAGAAWSIYVRAAGSEAVLTRYRKELGAAVAGEIDGQPEKDGWLALSNFHHTWRDQHPQSLVLSMSLPLSEVRQVISAAQQWCDEHGYSPAIIGRVGLGHLLMSWKPLADGKGFDGAVAAWRSQLPRDASTAVLHCPRDSRPHVREWSVTPTNLDAMRAVKQALDPRGTLNRGRFLF